MKVAIFETEQWEHEACLSLEPRHRVSCTHATLTEQAAHLHADAEVVSPFVYSKLSQAVLAQFDNLKLVATRSTGYDHIDTDYCRARGIAVCNVPDYGDSTVAEHVFALLLGIARNLPESLERTRRGNFTQSDLRGFELRGKTLAVIGTGRIGKRVIEIANGLAMSVIAVDRQPDDAAAQRLGFRYAPLNEALACADIVTLHVPASTETAHLISDREFATMKPGAVLINTARGSVVDVAALVRALAEGKIKAAGLDVLPLEPALRDEAEIFRSATKPSDQDLKALVANHVLLRFPNVFVTPHNAYNTTEAVGRIIGTTMENIEAFARGEPRNVVA
ncbi:MAG: hydroxyacid dehydrogenase [Hyphomonadaceae bacterium]|nr:hydroxyacid dehydrogenase [Hyphomonadaceae bacterium]